MAIRFKERDVRAQGRVTRGVKSITLRTGDYVVGMAVSKPGEELLSVSEKGYGKRTSFDEYRMQSRAGMGTINYKCSESTGKIAGIDSISEYEDIIIITSEGIIIRIAASDVRSIGRSTKGVRLVKMNEGVKVVSFGKTEREEEAPQEESAGEVISQNE